MDEEKLTTDGSGLAEVASEKEIRKVKLKELTKKAKAQNVNPFLQFLIGQLNIVFDYLNNTLEGDVADGCLDVFGFSILRFKQQILDAVAKSPSQVDNLFAGELIEFAESMRISGDLDLPD